MSALFNLHIRSADRDFYEGECAQLSLRLSDGELGLLANHSPMVAAVTPGLLTYRTPEGESVTVVAGSGIVRFAGNDALVVLDSVERPEEIDVQRARAAEAMAQLAIKASRTPQERAKARGDMERAKNRLRAAEFLQ